MISRIKQLSSQEIQAFRRLLWEWGDDGTKNPQNIRILILRKGQLFVRHYNTVWQAYLNFWQEPQIDLDTSNHFKNSHISIEIVNAQAVWVNDDCYTRILQNDKDNLITLTLDEICPFDCPSSVEEGCFFFLFVTILILFAFSHPFSLLSRVYVS
jgi:hypothetical protein